MTMQKRYIEWRRFYPSINRNSGHRANFESMPGGNLSNRQNDLENQSVDCWVMIPFKSRHFISTEGPDDWRLQCGSLKATAWNTIFTMLRLKLCPWHCWRQRRRQQWQRRRRKHWQRRRRYRVRASNLVSSPSKVDLRVIRSEWSGNKWRSPIYTCQLHDLTDLPNRGLDRTVTVLFLLWYSRICYEWRWHLAVSSNTLTNDE